jgi:hypothetical protein
MIVEFLDFKAKIQINQNDTSGCNILKIYGFSFFPLPVVMDTNFAYTSFANLLRILQGRRPSSSEKCHVSSALHIS